MTDRVMMLLMEPTLTLSLYLSMWTLDTFGTSRRKTLVANICFFEPLHICLRSRPRSPNVVRPSVSGHVENSDRMTE